MLDSSAYGRQAGEVRVFDMPAYSNDDLAKVVLGVGTQVNDLVKEHLHAACHISEVILIDVVRQWHADMRRLAAAQPHGIRATKSMASMAYWFKKLKPIYAAYRTAAWEAAAREGLTQPESSKEIHDVNERVAVMLAIQQLVDYAISDSYRKHVRDINPDAPEIKKFNRGHISNLVKIYLHHKTGASGEDVYDNFVYNLRYRAFAPHHIAHILDQILIYVTYMNEERRNTK